MIHRYGIVRPVPGSCCPQYDQVGGPGQSFYICDTRKPILNDAHLETDIQRMSVEQTCNWIWDLGSGCGWNIKDRIANVTSFSSKQIDGNQLVRLGVEDLHKLKVVKKLGHMIDIVMAVNAFKSRLNIIEQRNGNDNGCSVVDSQAANILPGFNSSPTKPRMEKLAISPISNIDEEKKLL